MPIFKGSFKLYLDIRTQLQECLFSEEGVVYLRGRGERGAHVYLQAVPVHTCLSQAFVCHEGGRVQALRRTAKQILLSGIWLFRRCKTILSHLE